jgi:V8-like Glu-specific endopeptidase
MIPSTPSLTRRLVHGLAAASFLFGAACDEADGPAADTDLLTSEAITVVPRADFEAAELHLDPADLDTVDHGDGTWSRTLPPGFDPEVRVRGKLLTWVYAGQAKFSKQPTQGAERTWIATEPEAHDPEAQLFEMTRVDRFGRIWRVEDVDRAAWAQRTAVAPEENEGDEPDADTPLRGSAEEPAPGTVVKWKPMSWDHDSCEPGGGLNPNELHLWDGESRNEINNPSGRKATAVQIRVNGSVVCSGVIIRGNQVLTGAHCVSDDNNNPINPLSVTVQRVDVNEFRSASDIDFSGSYGGGSGSGGGSDFADDWAIIETTSFFSAGYEDMDLSSASDATLDALNGVHNLAFPQFFPNCTATSPVGQTLIHHKEMEPIAATQNKKVRLEIDGSPGHSGSPVYYCPAGDNNSCAPGDTAFVFGVIAGWDTSDNRFVGPKVPFFKDAATAFMDD